MATSSRWFVPLLAGVVVLAGCGSGSGAADPVHTSPEPVPDGCAQSDRAVSCARDDLYAKGPVSVQGASKGGTVTVLSHSGLRGTLDPSEVYRPDVLSIDRALLTRSLTQYRYDPQSKQMILVPDLATDLGQHNDDYTKWSYTVRPGVRFENGERVTAAAVVRGIRRCMHAATSPTAPCRSYANRYIRSVEVVHHGNYVMFHMSQPFPDLPYFGTFPEMGPLPAGQSLDPASYRLHPQSTGPYKIVTYRPGRTLVLTRNPEWDPITDPARTQYPDGYVFRAGMSSDAVARTLLQDTGDGQTALTYDELSPHAYAHFHASAPHRLVLGDQPCTTYVAPDNRTVTSPLVRRALALAYPYRAVVRLDGGIPGVTAVAATNLTPPGIPGRTAVRPHTSAFRTEPRAARTLLRRAHALGYEIRFAFDPSEPSSVRTKDVLVGALRRAGFHAQSLATVGGTALIPRTQPQVNLRTTTRCGDWPAGSAWTPGLFGTARSPRSGLPGDNLSAFSQPAVDRRIAEIARIPLEQQSAAYDGLEHEILRRWSPAFPVSYGGVDMAHGSRINGMADDTTLGMPTWQSLWVTP